ncbi:MAG: hypothetical protein ABIL11_02955 [Chloroflexota bacterium]
MVVGEMRTSRMISLEPVGFVDDDSFKQGAVIHGVRVHGNLAKIPELVEEYRVQEVIIAMPAALGGMAGNFTFSNSVPCTSTPAGHKRPESYQGRESHCPG